MRCSRVALSLLPAIFAAAVIALGPADGQIGVAADLGLEQSPHGDTYKGVGDCQTVTDWREDDSTGGQQPSISTRWESDTVNEDATPVADADADAAEDQPASGSDDPDEGHPAETSGDVEQPYGHDDQSSAQYPCPEENHADEAQVTEETNTDEGYTNQYGNSESETAGESHDPCQPGAYDSENAEAGNPKLGYRGDSEAYPEQENAYTDQPAASDSENAEAGNPELGYRGDSEAHPEQENAYTDQPAASDSENAEAGNPELGYQADREPSPDEADAYTEDEEEYTYEYEYSDPEGKYGYAEGLSEQADEELGNASDEMGDASDEMGDASEEMGDASEDQSNDDYGHDEGQEGESGKVQETQSGGPAESEYVDPCQPDGSQGYDGHDTLQETTGAESAWQDGTTAEGAVWGAIVSWASRSLEELGDACHSLSRQISGLSGESWTVGSRRDAGIR